MISDEIDALSRQLEELLLSDEANAQQLFEEFAPEATAVILRNLPINRTPEVEAKPDAGFAQDVSEVLGADWCQAWYHFVVLMTRLNPMPKE